MLPPSGQVYLDTQAVIYSVETIPVYWPLLQPAWDASRAGQITLVSSDLTLMETLVGLLKRGDPVLMKAYEDIYQSAEVRLIPITQPVLREAARLRATIPGLRTPDALHAATAILAGCHPFLTNDYGFRRIPGLAATILDEVLAS
jgi:predicted nucleic acid-binding protein